MLSEILHKIAADEYAAKEEQVYRPRPSLAGPERCIRQLTYMARGDKPKGLAGRAVMVFDDSIWHEELTLNWLRKSNYVVHSEQLKIEVDGMHGSIDAIITDILNIDRLLEHKAISHFGFEELLKGHLPLDYLTQMAFYLKGLQKLNPDICEGILLVKNKNQSAYLDYLTAYDNKNDDLHIFSMTSHTGEIFAINKIIEHITKDAMLKFAEVEKHRQAGTLPDRQYEIDTWRCGYCPYKEPCWAGWVTEHEALSTDVTLEGEIADLVRYRQETAAHEYDMKKEKDELTEKIKALMADKNIRSGRTSEYTVDWTVKTIKKFNKELLPAGVYGSAQEDIPQEYFKVKKIKGGGK